MLISVRDKIPHHRKGLIYLSVTALLWSSSGLFIKILSLDAFRISFFRSAIAALTIFIISRLRFGKFDLKVTPLVLLNSFFYAGILIFFVIATKMTTAANAIFLQFTAPVYLLFLEPLFLKTKFKIKDLVTVVITLSGMILFFTGKLETGNIYGNLFAILAGICFALFSLVAKWKRNDKPEGAILSVITGNILIAIICLPLVINNLSLNSREIIILSYMGIVQIGISYFIFNIGIKYVSATEALIIGMLEAVFNPVWVFIGIGETPNAPAIAGGIIIFTAILIHNLISGKKRINL